MAPLNRRAFMGTGIAGVTISSSEAKAASQDAAAAQPGKTPHTRFAVNIEMWWRRLPLLERIKQAAKLGFPAIEFWPYENKDIPAVAELCRQLGVEVAQFTAWGFKPGLNHPDNEAAFVAKIQESCEIAHQLSCRKMTVVAGNNQAGMTQEQMHTQVIRALRRAAPIADRERVTLILEPMNGRVDHPGHCLYGSTDAIKICQAVDSPSVKINWDLYHMQITEGDLCGHLKEGIEQIGYLQLADHPGRNEPGTGEIHYNRVLKEAYDLGYRDYVGLECRPKTTEIAAATAVAAADVW